MTKPMKRRRWIYWLTTRAAAVVALGALFWFAPLFHIVRLNAAGQRNPQQQTTGAPFDASSFVEKLWADGLTTATDRTTDANALLAEIRKDPKGARAKHGRGSELGSGYYYHVAGAGRVIAVKPDGVALAITNATARSGSAGAAAMSSADAAATRAAAAAGSTSAAATRAAGTGAASDAATGAAGEADVVLESGNIFGNAARDGTGLVDVNRFANSQDFNAISSEINRRIEERVLPALREQAVVGATVRFVGCAEVVSEETDLRPLRVVPLSATVVR